MRGERGWLGQKRLEEEPKKIIVVGVGNIADVAYEFLKSDSPYEMVAFSVEEAHMASETKFGLPIVPFETLEKKFSPAEYGLFIAVGYGRLNHLRGDSTDRQRAKGTGLFPISVHRPLSGRTSRSARTASFWRTTSSSRSSRSATMSCYGAETTSGTEP